MNVVNGSLASKGGFTAGEMEAKIDAILDMLQKRVPPL